MKSDLASFARTAMYCDESIETVRSPRQHSPTPRFQCNLVIRKRRSAADVIRGVRNASALYSDIWHGGLLQLRAESSLPFSNRISPTARTARSS